MSNDESEDKKSSKNESESEENEIEKLNQKKKEQQDDEYNSEEDADYNISEEEKNKKRKKLIGNKRKRDVKKKKQKKEKNTKNYFFEDEAEEDEEEESYGHGEITKEEQEKAIQRYDERHFSDRNKQMKITEDNVDLLAKKYNEKEFDEEEDVYEDLDKRPTSSDPKLWLIKCKIGEEKDVLANLYHKFFYFKSKEPKDRLKIFSITTFDNLKGKIFVEAFSERDIIYAINGMSNVNQNSIQLIPLDERLKIFEYDKFQKIEIYNNQLVRIKAGNYEGDLAKVVYVEDPVNKIYIALIPRIYENTKDKNKDSFEVAPFSKKRFNIRPRQKLFTKKYGENITNIHEPFGDCIKFGKSKFRDGLLVKPVRINLLETENINPKEEEMQKLGCYKNEDGIYLDKTDNRQLIISNKQSAKYNRGDKIKFVTGDFKDITGTVISQIGNNVSVKVDLKDVEGVYEFPTNMITIYYNFKPGEIVYVKKGENKGKYGIILKILDNNSAMIYDEITETRFNAKNSDLILKKFMDFEDEENAMFKIGDLVRIKNENKICYIIESSKFILKVVTSRNEMKQISVREVEKLNLSKKSTCVDGKGNPIAQDNIVKVINGQFKGSKGTIKCIYKKFLFLHNNSYIRTNGIFCEINDNVELLGSELLIENSEKGKVNHRKVPNEIKDMIGKIVHVVEGRWKGYNGILIDANDKSIKLELTAKQKTIQLPPSYIKEGDINSAKDNEGLALTPTLSMKTPAYYLNNEHN